MQRTGRWPGIALPFGSDLAGTLAPKVDAAKLRSDVFLMVMTRLGERVMLPEFGTTVPMKVFEQNDLATEAEIQEEIQDAIARWDEEGRINLHDVVVKREQNTTTVSVIFSDATDPVPQEVQSLQFDLLPSYATILGSSY